MSSPATLDQRHFRADGQLSNLDRCARCGELRSAHGQDWDCPASGKPGRAPAISFVVASLVTVAGFIMLSTASGLSSTRPLNTLGGIFFAGGLTIAVAAAVVIRKQRTVSTGDE
jgi:hypothetical protein